jgi:hypothetical protein
MAYAIPPGFITDFTSAEKASLSAQYKDFITIQKSSLLYSIKKWEYKSRVEQAGVLASILSQIYNCTFDGCTTVGTITTFNTLPVFTLPNEMMNGSLVRAGILEDVIKSLQSYGDDPAIPAPPPPYSSNTKKVILLYNRPSVNVQYTTPTITGSNGLKFKTGDVITLNNFTISPTIRDWRQINGSYIIRGITTELGLYVEVFYGSIQWSTGGTTSTRSLNLPFSAGQSLSSKNGVQIVQSGLPYGTWTGVARLDYSVTLLPPEASIPDLVVVPTPPDNPTVDLNPIVGIFPITDPYIEPVQTTPTKPVAVAPPAATTPTKPTPTVKVSGTTVSIPFLTSASFKPGISAAANAKGKAAFITLVKKASVASKLTKEQDAQLLATVYEAIDKAMLVKKSSLTALKAPTIVVKKPIKKV